MCECAGAVAQEGKGEELISSKSSENMFYTCSGHILKLQITSTTRPEPTSGLKRAAPGERCSTRQSPTLASGRTQKSNGEDVVAIITHSFSYVHFTT